MKVSYFILFLVILSTWRMRFVGDKKLSSQHLPVLPGRNHDDTVLIASLDGTIHLVERNSWKVRWSFSSGPALCSSYQTLTWGKDDTKSFINGTYRDNGTGRVKCAVTTDVNEQYLIKKDMGESTNMPAAELLITRTNYKLHSYFRDTLEPAWNVTVGYIKFMHHLLEFWKDL
ncbi:hypothetical protein AAC387_Pa07g0313 [Persea americana]